jgi:hypothetical protein
MTAEPGEKTDSVEVMATRQDNHFSMHVFQADRTHFGFF